MPMFAAISRSKLVVVSQVLGSFSFGLSTRLLAALMLLKSVPFRSRFTSPGWYSLSLFRSCQLNVTLAVAFRLKSSAYVPAGKTVGQSRGPEKVCAGRNECCRSQRTPRLNVSLFVGRQLSLRYQ